jgi:FMN phosphatase YigB (HAD superfamily)
MKISGCVFDFGGVMTKTTMPELVHKNAQALGLNWDIFIAGYDKYRRLLDGNFLSFEEMYDLIFADADVNVSAEDKASIIKSDKQSFVIRNEDTLQFMRSLKKSGMKIGILTNMATAFVPLFKKHFSDFLELADAVVISGEEKMFKPQKRIYQLLQERISLPGEELCFFDDVEANCEGAKKCSWKAVQFVNAEDASKNFEIIKRS